MCIQSTFNKLPVCSPYSIIQFWMNKSSAYTHKPQFQAVELCSLHSGIKLFVFNAPHMQWLFIKQTFHSVLRIGPLSSSRELFGLCYIRNVSGICKYREEPSSFFHKFYSLQSSTGIWRRSIYNLQVLSPSFTRISASFDHFRAAYLLLSKDI